MELADYFGNKLRLETDRLILRKLSVSDAMDMYEYSCNPETSVYLLWDVHPYYSYTVEMLRRIQKEYACGTFFDLAIVLKEQNKMIGTVGFTSFDAKNSCAEAGYVINPVYKNRGIATEALKAIQNFAFCELGVNRLEAKYVIGNDASRRVMEKCGMHFEGVQRQRLLVKGTYRDVGICSILKSEYFAETRENIYRKNLGRPIFTRLFHKN